MCAFICFCFSVCGLLLTLLSCVRIVTRVQRVDNQGIEFESQHGHRFSFLHTTGPIQPPIQLLEVNHLGHKADNLPARTAEVKNVT
jgi:hypothetical protein